MNNWGYFTSVMSLTPIFMMLAALALLIWQRRHDKRRDPLTTELRALPGASLHKQLNAAWEKFFEQYLGVVLVAIGCTQVILIRHLTVDLSALNLLDYGLIGVVLVTSALFARKAWRLPAQRRKLRDGLRAEISSAQEIVNTLSEHFYILHDIQGNGFNIDHVVISPAGVFAVETKSRRKPPAGSGQPSAEFDGTRIRFTDWEETAPVAQAERQALWLRQFLKRETGADFPVRGVVSLPGWFVTFTPTAYTSAVRVINPKMCKSIFLPNKPPLLNAERVQQAHATIGKISLAPDMD